MAIKTDVLGMDIGDKIICGYAGRSGLVGQFSRLGSSTIAEIPTTSSATPNGSFYYVYVGDDFLGRRMLIADRNVQHSISWDTLNTAGIASGSGLPTLIKLVPDMADYAVPAPFVVSSSSKFQNGEVYAPWKSFSDADASHFIASASGGANEWIQIDIGTAKTIDSYDFANSGDLDGSYVSTWQLLGSNTGVFAGEEVILDSQSGKVMNKAIINYKVVATQSFRYYRWKLIAGHSYFGLGKIRLYEHTKDKYTTRLLTGGVSNVDVDNEWDQHIANSTLDGTISAGDNAVWNWEGRYSWTSTPIIGGDRTVRGYWTPSTFVVGGFSSAYLDENGAFRPVLLVEINTYPCSFVKVGTDYKSFIDDTWQTVSETLPSINTFINEGMESLSILDRKETIFIQNMTNNGALGAGKVFKSTVDLARFIELLGLNVR